MLKRTIVGFMVLAWYVFPMYVHPLVFVFVSWHIVQLIQDECFNVWRKDFEQNLMYSLFYHGHSLLMFYFLQPKIGFLQRSIVEASGFTEQTNPFLFFMLYEKNSQISLGLFSILFIVLLS